MKKAVLVLMILVGVVCSIFAETRTKQLGDEHVLMYDTNGNSLYNKNDFMYQVAMPMWVTTYEDKGWELDEVLEYYLTLDDVALLKDVLKYVDVYSYTYEISKPSDSLLLVWITWFDNDFNLDAEIPYRCIQLIFIK